MKITLDTILRISGSAADDRRVAEEFAREELTEAEARFGQLYDLRVGKVILDAAGLRTAWDACVGIRHLHALLQEAVEFHRRSELQKIFVAAHEKVKEMQQTGDAIYLRLSQLCPDRV